MGVHGEREDVILWTKAHGHGMHHFIVATREAITDARKASEAVPVSLLSAEVVIHYRVNDLPTFLYKKAEPVKVLEALASREVVRFVVSVDLFDIIGPGRLEASRYLTEHIRECTGDAGLGIEILYAGFENVHPPVEVASAFQEVVGAIEEQHTKVLAAETYRNRVLPLAESEKIVLKTRAGAYRFRRGTVASGTIEQFKKQNEADKTLSRVYRIRRFLDTLEDGLKDTRKYIVPQRPNARQVTIVDLKEKLRPELLDMDLTGMEEK